MTLDLSQSNDRELTSLAVVGNEQAFRELIRRHRDPLYRLVKGNVGDHADALDILQESFVAAFSAIERYDGERPFRFWISRIALNKCRDWLRRRTVRSFFTFARPIVPGDEFEHDAPGPQREADSRAELARVEEAIARLPHGLREVLVLRTIEELSQADAALTLGISEKAVETRLYRARAKLRTALSGKAELAEN